MSEIPDRLGLGEGKQYGSSDPIIPLIFSIIMLEEFH